MMEVDDDVLDDVLSGDEGGEEHEEVDKNSAPLLLEKLRQIVRQRLGCMDEVSMKGNDGGGDKSNKENDESLVVSSPRPTMTHKNKSKMMVASARALAQLSASTFDGEEGPGAARAAFNSTFQKLKEFVVDPYLARVSRMDRTSLQRLAGELKKFGDATSRMQHLKMRIQSLAEFAKVEHDERELGIDKAFGFNSLCLPSKLYGIAKDLNLDFVNELSEEKKVYLTYGVNLALEISYLDKEIKMTASLLNEAGDETSLQHEAEDILESFKMEDMNRGLEILHDKFRALIRRSDLEIQLKAGSLHNLKTDVEKVMRALPNCKVTRVARGLDLTLPGLATTDGKSTLVPPTSQQGSQHLIASLTYRHDLDATQNLEALSWMEKTSLVITLEPPIEMSSMLANYLIDLSALSQGDKNSNNGGTKDPTLMNGAALALLLSKQGYQPIMSDALQDPPQVSTTILFRTTNDQSAKRVVVVVDKGESAENRDEGRLASIVQQVALKPDQHDVIPTVVNLVQRQNRFNALVSSIVHSPKIVLETQQVIQAREDEIAEAEAVVNKESNTTNKNPAANKRPRIGSISGDIVPLLATINANITHKRILMCPARREFLKKTNRSNVVQEDGGADDDDEEGSVTQQEEQFEIQDDRQVTVKILPPKSIEIEENKVTKCKILVDEQANVQIESENLAGLDLASFLQQTHCVPFAIYHTLNMH